MNASEPNYCVTLVHGTFAPNSAWTQEGSVLRATLKSRLDHSVVFSAPDWGGANTQAARQRGAKLIEDVVSKQMEQYPAADHFVIAHSHGGNVALMACCSAQIAAQLKGLVCLATPFLSFRPRRYLLNLRLLAFTAIAYFLLVLMLMVAGGDAERQTSKSTGVSGEQSTGVNHPDRGTLRRQGDSLAGFFTGTYPGVTRRLGTAATMIFLALCCAMAVWGSLRLTQKAARKIDQLQERAGARYRTPKDVPFRLLGVSLPWDEARVWLRALWRLAEVPFWLNPILIWFFGFGLLGMVFLELPGSLATLNLDRSPPAWIWSGFWNVLFVIVTVALFAVATQAAMLLSVFIRGNPLGYGWDGFTTAWVGRIMAREAPPLPGSRYETLKVKEADITAEIGQGRTWSKLRHSLPYESPAVVRAIAEWMKQQAEHPGVKT